jgi:hypothetical protein
MAGPRTGLIVPPLTLMDAAFPPTSPTNRRPRIALLACAVFEREIALFAQGGPQIVEQRWFEMGWHDRPAELRTLLQTHLDAVDARDDIDAVVLAYGLCGLGTAGLRPRRHRLVIPRAHDCITVFLGSKEAYAEHQRRCPSCYYYTPGWNRGLRVPGPDQLASLRAEYAAKFESDDVEFLLQNMRDQWAQHDTAAYVDLGTEDAAAAAAYARQCASWLGWKFEPLRGDPGLLRDLLNGRWDADRFQIIEPGGQLAHAPDEYILRSEPAGKLPHAS